jgi:hypothetical protein
MFNFSRSHQAFFLRGGLYVQLLGIPRLEDCGARVRVESEMVAVVSAFCQILVESHLSDGNSEPIAAQRRMRGSSAEN